MPHVIESTAEMPHFIQSCPWKGQKVPLILLRAGKVSKYSMHPCRQIMVSSSCRYQMVSYSCFTSPEPEMTQNSCPIRQRSSKSYEILLSKPFNALELHCRCCKEVTAAMWKLHATRWNRSELYSAHVSSKTIATVLEQFRLLKGQKAMNSKSSLFEGCLLGGRK